MEQKEAEESAVQCRIMCGIMDGDHRIWSEV